MRLTPEQERALAVEGRRVAIAAGAGSGKTMLLCEAIWRDVEERGIPIDEIFVATYNRAAAAHLVARLQARFACGRGPDRPGLDLSAAWVGTFHGLCARIARQHPFAAGVDPEFGELDEAEAGALVDAALDTALAATRHEGLWTLLASVLNTDRVREAIVAVHGRLRAAGMQTPTLVVPDAAGPSPGDLAEADRLVRAIGAHPDLGDRHEAGAAAARAMLDLGSATPECPRIHASATKALKALIAPCNELLETIWTAYLAQDARPQLEGFAALLRVFCSAYDEAKTARGALDYEDLQMAARRVLRAERPYRFRRVYVDEFQDANAIQNDILDLLDAERTVVVGDGTQAIYGFRHADATHFLARVSQSETATLTDNHRSHADVLGALNGLLAHVLADDPSFTELRPKAPDPPDVPPMRTPAVEVVSVVGPDGARASRAQEAVALRDAIGQLVVHGYRYGDIAVLFRALTQVGAYREALDDAGIPHHLVMGQGFFTHDQVADVLALLALVENPRDEMALVRALGSPYVAASDAELVAMRRAAGPRQPLVDARGAIASLDALLSTVEELRSERRERGLAGLVEAAAGARGYELAALGLSEGERRYANLRKLVRLAAGFEAVRGPDLRGFLGWIALQEALGVDPGEATLVDPARDAVALATIHSVKGQEFPVVILADASHGTPSESGVVLSDRAGRAGIAVRAPGTDTNTPVLGLAELRESEKAEREAEERRLLYVALTRAQRHAIVIGRDRADRGSTHHRALAGALDALGASRGEVCRIGEAGVAWRRPVVDAAPEAELLPDPVVPATTPAPAPRVGAPPSASPLRGRRLSFSALATLGTCARRFHLEYERGLRGRDDAIIAGDSPLTGSIWGGTVFGDLVHHLLAEHDWAQPLSAGQVAAMARAAGLPESAPDVERAERLVGELLSGPIGDRVRGAERTWFERPFTLEIDGAVLNGAIDLMIEESDGTVRLYDWKTHALAGRDRAQLEDAYRLQMAIYGLAALRSGARSARLDWVYLEDQGDPLWRIVDQTGRHALESLVRSAFGVLAAPERPPVSRSPIAVCSRCPGLDSGCPVAE